VPTRMSALAEPTVSAGCSSSHSGTSLNSGISGTSVGRVLAVVPPVLEGLPLRRLVAALSSLSADSVRRGFGAGGARRVPLRRELIGDDAPSAGVCESSLVGAVYSEGCSALCGLRVALVELKDNLLTSGTDVSGTPRAPPDPSDLCPGSA
jgi:hypothetical protein